MGADLMRGGLLLLAFLVIGNAACRSSFSGAGGPVSLLMRLRGGAVGRPSRSQAKVPPAVSESISKTGETGKTGQAAMDVEVVEGEDPVAKSAGSEKEKPATSGKKAAPEALANPPAAPAVEATGRPKRTITAPVVPPVKAAAARKVAPLTAASSRPLRKVAAPANPPPVAAAKNTASAPIDPQAKPAPRGRGRPAKSAAAKEKSGDGGAGTAGDGGDGAKTKAEEDLAFGFYAVMGVPREASAKVQWPPQEGVS